MNSSRTAISIILADDHPVVLHGMASILRSQPDFNVGRAVWGRDRRGQVHSDAHAGHRCARY